MPARGASAPIISLFTPLHPTPSPLPQSAHDKQQRRGTWVPLLRYQPSSCSDALLKGSQREGLDDLFRWLRLHHHHLAKDLLLASLCGRLDPRLQLEEAGDREGARLASHLLGCNGRQAADELRANL